MTSTAISLALALALGATGDHGAHPRQGWLARHYAQRTGGYILGPGPGNGWGFPNGNPDGYGWYDLGPRLPIAGGRTADYYFRRYYSVPAEQLFISTYYNPYVSQGQRYIPYSNCGGPHPASGLPYGSAVLSMHPYNDTLGTGPRVPIPSFTGRVEAPPINTGNSGLTP